MTRPRRRSGAASWSDAFAFDVQTVKARPATKSRGATAARVVWGASASSARPNPPTPARRSRGLAREIAAEASAPRSAPAPKNAVTMPNTSGPSSSVRLASTGKSTLKLKESVVTKRTTARTTPASGTRRRKANASRVPRTNVGRSSPRSSANSSAGRMSRRLPSTARKLTAFSRKQAPGPAAAMTAPPSAGPTMRAPLKRLELRATALGSSLRPTIWNVRAWRAGWSRTSERPRRPVSR